MATTVERLTELLDKKDEELSEATEKIERLERELDGSLNGWRRETETKDDGVLPLPRLELAYRQRRGWSDYDVAYQIVYRHLLGHVVEHPLSWTRISGGPDSEPSDLPFRDGAHAAHDAVHLGMPCYRIVPGREPKLLDFDGHEYQQKEGEAHRREKATR